MSDGRANGNVHFGRSDWIRVSREHPCPVCGRHTWCLVSRDGCAAICPRTPEGATKDLGEAGYLHVLDDRRWQRPRHHASRSIPLVDVERGPDGWGQLASRFSKAVDPKRLLALAETLAVTEDSLRRLSVGWSRRHQAWTFPMKNARGIVRGIRLRRLDGRKLSVRGGHEGLFIPSNLAGSPLLITEGPTDCAALLDLGFAAIGRPSCRGAVQFTAEFVCLFQPAAVVIVADRDVAGRSGAEALASTLIVYTPRLRVITPPEGMKDARAWKAAGATHRDVLSAIDAAAVRSLAITTGGTDGPR